MNIRLNGWQRLGIVLSVLWLALVITYAWSELDAGPFATGPISITNQFFTDPPEKTSDGHTLRTVDFELRIGRFLALAFGPIVTVWFSIYLILFLARWIKDGFASNDI